MQTKEQILENYKNDVKNLRKCAKNLDLSDDQINEIFNECIALLEKENPRTKIAQKYLKILLKLCLAFIFIFLILYILLNVHQPTSSIVLRNVQGLIYPGLKFVRFLSVPIIKQFPKLTYLYDESCLVENPYFYVSEMECWPCQNVYSVMDLTGFDNHSLYQTQTGIPYITKSNLKEISFKTVQKLFNNNKQTFITEANSFKSTNQSHSTIEHVFEHNPEPSSHILWRINKMLPARLIRTLFPRPHAISAWSGQSIERFLLIDGAKSEPYAFPNTECSYIFVTQGFGERTVVLKPSRECGHACRTVSVVLKPAHVLWYNWWYWRPISLPAENSTETSITYLTSYC